MRVLHVTPSLSELRGGTSRAVLEIVKAQRAQGLEAEIATTNDDGTGLLDAPLGQRVAWDGVPAYFFGRFSPPSNPVREFAFSWPLTGWLRQSMRTYDLVHVHALFSYAATAAMGLARALNVPYVCTPHGLLCEWSLRQSAAKKRAYLGIMERANLDAAAMIHFTDAAEQRESIPLHLRAPSTVVPLGIEQPTLAADARRRLRQQFDLPPDAPVLVFMGRLHPKKGLGFLIPALGRLAAERFAFVLAGAGDSEYEREIDNLLAAANILDRTYRPGFVSGEEKALLLQGADLFVLTSHSENFGIAVLEALAAGVPALLTPGVSLATLVEGQQLGYVTPLDVESIANTLRRFLHDLPAAQRMGERAKSYVLANYTWDHTAAHLSQVYEAVIGEKTLRSAFATV